jgi:hypothetical protein
MSPTETNYDIHDKEMLAVIASLKKSRLYLEGAIHSVMIYPDHKDLEYWTTTKTLNRYKTHWAQVLTYYDFKIVYRSGSQKDKPDALSS